ncbi:hypothetical protein M9Y10_021391 [Tritrichomonas musculus]|uniref:Uncharacterized protein n=1 Tax=Tritrichomonas musculus TaxID=1915356 RepID=A0ABR2HFU1_9EUKA
MVGQKRIIKEIKSCKTKKLKNNYKYLGQWKDNEKMKKTIALYNKYAEKSVLAIQNCLNNVLDEINLMFKDKNTPIWANIVSNLYSNCPQTQQQFMNDAFRDLFTHKTGEHWNENILQLAYLIKYCNTSCYRRLWILSNFKLPPPTTIDTHFESKTNLVEYCLSNADEIDFLLDKYWESNKSKIQLKNENDIASYKIRVCLGCDAASLTTFLKVNNDEEMEETEENQCNISNDNIKEMKNQIFKNIVDGNFSASHNPEIINYLQLHDKLIGDNASFFFSFLILPFDWRLPVMAVHLSKSESGHVSLKEACDIEKLISKIQDHSHFSIKHFSADGETGLNGFHLAAYERYSSFVNDVLDGDMSIDDFINKVYLNCKIIPIIDMLHAVKSARNRLINNQMKLGEHCDIIDSFSLQNDLGIYNDILQDHSSLGRMKDAYPLNLFTAENASMNLAKVKKRPDSTFYYIL